MPMLESGGAADPILRKVHSLNLAHHVLSTGPRYEIEDIRCGMVASLGQHTSGVLCECSLLKTTKISYKLLHFQPHSVWH